MVCRGLLPSEILYKFNQLWLDPKIFEIVVSSDLFSLKLFVFVQWNILGRIKAFLL